MENKTKTKKKKREQTEAEILDIAGRELFLNLLTFVDKKDHAKFIEQLNLYVDNEIELEKWCNE